MANLTPREAEIRDALLRGEKSKEIASRLWLGHETVRTHIKHIREKLGYPSVWEMRVADAFEKGRAASVLEGR